jgi:hypothetical protein
MKVKKTKSGYKLVVESTDNFYDWIEDLAKAEDTGNGFIIKFPANSNCRQDKYICLDYDEVEYLSILLGYVMQQKGFKE